MEELGSTYPVQWKTTNTLILLYCVYPQIPLDNLMFIRIQVHSPAVGKPTDRK